MINRENWNNSVPMWSSPETIMNYIVKYFHFRNIELTKENGAVILKSLIDFANQKKILKSYDFYLALKLYSDPEERNLSASYFLTRIKKYIASDDYKNFIINNIPKIEETRKELNIKEEALKNLACIEEGYKKHGRISAAMSDNMFDELVKCGIFNFIELDEQEIEFNAFGEEKQRQIKLAESQLDHIIAREHRRNFDDIDLGVFKLNSKEKIIRRYKMKLYLENKFKNK